MSSRRHPLQEISENDAMSSPNAAISSRRKSGRAVKVPEKFQPDTTLATEPANGKRKRAGDDAIEDVENDSEENESESEEEEASADEEETRAAKKRARTTKKPAAKKPKVNGTKSHTPETIARLPSRPKKAKKVAIADADAEGLYAEVFKSGDTSEKIALDWLKQFEDDNAIALKNIVNLVLKSAGCDQEVTEDDINDPDHAPLRLQDLQEEEKGKEAPDYPLIKKGGHAFRDALTGFFDALLRTIHASGVLYDEIALIENLHLWVTTMSSSSLRPFRHTATVISLTLATSLCRVATEQADQNAKTERQLEGEKRKKTPNQGRMKEFQQVLNQGNERRETCENAIRDFFDTVFVHRYRDVDPRIRTECVEALGNWMILLPGTFFSGEYLRYLGWILSDSSPPTRLEVLKQLQRIMEDDTKIGGMRHFIERFRPRIVEMAAQDSEANVRTAAIDLLDLIREAEMLEPDDIDTIGKLIFDSELRVRRAVVGFFAANINDMYQSKVEELGGQEAVEDIYASDGDDHENPRPSWIKLKCLTEVLLNYDADGSEDSNRFVQSGSDGDNLRAATAESRFSLAAQALHDELLEVQDWETIAGYLLFDHSTSGKASSKNALERQIRLSFRLDEKNEAILLEILYASVKLDLLVSDDQERQKDGSKKRKQTRANPQAQETARRLALLIPQLLKKFAANPVTTTAVLRLEQILNLDVFQQLRQDSTAYAALLHEITTQFSRHADQRVLSEASAALLHAKAYNELDDVTEDELQSLWEDTLADFRRRFPKSDQMTVRGDLSLNHLAELGNTVSRIAKLASISNPIEHFESQPVLKGKVKDRARLTVIEMLFECAARGLLEEPNAEFDDTEDRLVTAANKAALFYFMWKARNIKQAILQSNAIHDIEIEQLKDRQDTFARALTNTFSSRADIDELRLVATGTFLDLHVLNATIVPRKAGPQRVDVMEVDEDSQYAYVQTLSRVIAPDVQKEITDIFAQVEKKFAKKARRTLEAPADDDEPEDLESDSEDEKEDATDTDRKNEIMNVEHQLCDLTAKLVLAIMSGVIDGTGPLKGKLRSRIMRNRNKLGSNFKEVIAFLDEPKTKLSKKNSKAKNQQIAEAAKKSKELVDIEDDEDDALEEVEPEEGTEEDLRRRELLDDEPPISVADEDEADEEVDDDDEVLGD